MSVALEVLLAFILFFASIFVLNLSFFSAEGNVWATIGLSLVATVAMLAMSTKLMSNKNNRFALIAGLLCLYLSSAVFFAAAHFLLFIHSPFYYSFSDSTIEGAVIRDFDLDLSRVREMQNSSYAISKLLGNHETVEQLQRKSTHFVGKEPPTAEQLDELFTTPIEEYSFRVYKYTSVNPGGGFDVTFFDVRTGEDTARFSAHGYDFSAESYAVSNLLRASFEDQHTFRGSLVEFANHLDASRVALMDSIYFLLQGRPDWSYLDFLYFSGVTITTLGYGDIIPIATVSRLVVLLNTVFGVFFAAFAITLILWKNSRRR